jgi:6-phosphogluconolactonase
MIEKNFGKARVLVYPDKDTLVNGAVQFVRQQLRDAIEARGRAYLAISGGSTPKPVYEQLRHADGVDYSKVFVTFVDERNVPPSDEQSNFKMVDAAWFSSGVLPTTNILRMQGELEASEAAAKYEQELRRLNLPQQDDFPIFDLILLGMGSDGHTASLFPDTEGLHETKRWVIGNHVEKLQTNRITLTYPVLNHARVAAFLAAGADKAEPLSEVLSGKSNLPSAGIAPVDGRLVWLIDESAAKLLS